MQEEVRRLSIIIPVYNPDEELVSMVDTLLEKGFQDIIVVNDGSDEAHQEPLSRIEYKCTLIHHQKKRGRDKAIRTAAAFCAANHRRANGAIIVGRQKPEEVCACAESFVQNGCEAGRSVVAQRLLGLLHGLKSGEAVSFAEQYQNSYKTMLVNYQGIG